MRACCVELDRLVAMIFTAAMHAGKFNPEEIEIEKARRMERWDAGGGERATMHMRSRLLRCGHLCFAAASASGDAAGFSPKRNWSWRREVPSLKVPIARSQKVKKGAKLVLGRKWCKS